MRGLYRARRGEKGERPWGRLSNIQVIFYLPDLGNNLGSFNVAFQLYPYTHDGAVKLVKDLTLQLANFIVATLLVIRRDTSSTIVIFAAWISIVVFTLLLFQAGSSSFFHSFAI